MARVDVRLGPSLLRTHLDGVPLDLAARLLPARARLDPALLPHVFLHSAAQRRHAATDAAPMARQQPRMGRNALMGLLDSLEAGVRRLTWQPHGTEWGAYYENTNYEAAAFEAKQRLVACLLAATTAGPPPERVLDLGANTGLFSRIASRQRIFTLSLDSDPAAVETNYQNSRAGAAGEQHLLPLVQDLTDPSPGRGWAEEERRSLLARCRADGGDARTVVFALALVHHLAISHNVPLPRIADLLARLARFVIIEWVPKEDTQVQRLLARRPDIFPGYTAAGFEAAFAGGAGANFSIVRREPIPGTARTLYLLRRRESSVGGSTA
jgi:hypothetical protein